MIIVAGGLVRVAARARRVWLGLTTEAEITRPNSMYGKTFARHFAFSSRLDDAVDASQPPVVAFEDVRRARR